MTDSFTDSWSVTGHDGGTIVGSASTLVSTALVKAYLNDTPVEADDPLLALTITAACDYIEAMCGPVLPTLYTERFDGWGGDSIMLRHVPVQTVAYVIEYQSTGGPLTLPESTPAAQANGYQLDRMTGRMTRVFPGNWPRTYFPGSQNIEVSYTAGRSPIPATILMAAAELTAHWWQQGHQSRSADYGPDGSYDQVDERAGAWEAVPYRIEDKLRPFRTPGMA